MNKRPRLDVIGVPFALGGAKPGPARGPSTLYNEGIVDVLSDAGFEVRYVDIASHADAEKAFSVRTNPRARVHSREAVKEAVQLAGAYVFASHRLGNIPIVIGGDHSISMGTLPQYLDPAISRGRNVGLVWIDAHFDAHTPRTTHSYYANGFPLASVLGVGNTKFGVFRRNQGGKRARLRFHPKNVLHIGAGDTDCEREETELLQRLKLDFITMQDIHEKGSVVCHAPLSELLARVDDVILTLDLDAIRHDFAPGVSFQSKNGMLPSQLFPVLRELAVSGKLRQVEIMEYNPDYEKQNTNFSPVTAHLVFDILQQLFK